MVSLRLRTAGLLIHFVVSVLSATPVSGKTVYVDAGASGEGSGVNWSNACTTIGAGLAPELPHRGISRAGGAALESRCLTHQLPDRVQWTTPLPLARRRPRHILQDPRDNEVHDYRKLRVV